MEYVTPIIVALLGSGIWTFLIEWIKCRRNKIDVEKKMILGLAHDALYKRLEKHLIDGYITIDDLENIEYLYQPYREMGGNGTCERMYEEICKLPHKKSE